MAEIATYTCSNKQCRLTVRLARDFPTPLNNSLVTLRTEAYCTSCKKVVANIDAQCAACNNAVANEHSGNSCPRCAVGYFTMPYVVVR